MRKSYSVIHSTKHIIDRIFLGESFIHAQRRRNLKIKLKIDTPLFIRVCIIPELTNIAMHQYFRIILKRYYIVLNKLFLQMTTRVLSFLNQWLQMEVVILMEITLKQVFIYCMTYDILHLSQIKNKSSSFLIYSKDTRGRRLYIATQGKHYVYLCLIIFFKFHYCDILCGFYWHFIIRPKAENNCRFLDDDLARGSV